MIKKLSPKRILALLLSAAAGAVLSLCRVMSAPAPFAAILPAALSPACGAASVFGAAAVGIFSSPAGAAPVIAASAAALIVRLRLGSANRSRALFTLSALSAAAYLLSSAFLCAFSGGGLWEILRALLSALLLFACDCVFVRASSQLGSVRGLAPPTLLFCCGAAVCALCSLRFGPVSLGGIAAAYFVLFAAQRFGPYAAASAAAVFAVGAGICSPSLFGVFALLAIPALICSLPAVSSPLRASLGMIAAVIPAAMLFGEPDGSIGLIIDCVIAAALFIPTYGHSLRLISRLAAGPEPVLRSYARRSRKYQTASPHFAAFLRRSRDRSATRYIQRYV